MQYIKNPPMKIPQTGHLYTIHIFNWILSGKFLKNTTINLLCQILFHIYKKHCTKLIKNL